MLLPFAAKGFRVMIHIIIVIIISVPIYSVQSMLVVFIDILKASYNPTLLFLIVSGLLLSSLLPLHYGLFEKQALV